MTWLWFGLGMFVGANVGIIVMAILVSRERKPLACQRCPENPDNYA